MTGPTPPPPPGEDRHAEHADHADHTDVGAYALGLLGDAEATRFEAHLAGCDRCGGELEALVRLGPVLQEAGQADASQADVSQAEHGTGDAATTPTAAAGKTPAHAPRPLVLDRLLADVSRSHRHRRRRRVGALIGAAVLAAVAVAVPMAVLNDDPTPAEAVRTRFQEGRRFSDHDPATDVKAAVALQPRTWGTHVTLRLGNVTGPRSCDLVAVGDDGHRQTVTTWSVPPYGYGIKGTRWAEPLYVEGGAALPINRIDHFEVRTLDGERLATIGL